MDMQEQPIRSLAVSAGQLTLAVNAELGRLLVANSGTDVRRWRPVSRSWPPERPSMPRRGRKWQ